MSVVIESLTAGYGRQVVLKEITSEVHTGRVCALIGPNGSGKTTLMRCINAILSPTRGRVVVAGTDVSFAGRSRIARLISVVPQNNYAPFAFSSLEMILMGAATRVKAWSSPGKEETEKARMVCAELGIEDLLAKSFTHLSGGQKQLVLLARALYQDAPVMLLDEPNSHLDFANQHRIMERVRKTVKEKGVTAVITLHDPNLALCYCDDVLMLKDGKVVAAGPTSEMMSNEYLTVGLGDNIMVDTTMGGMKVVVPRQVKGG
jgi:iron complex transport system ATP-binding protein